MGVVRRLEFKWEVLMAEDGGLVGSVRQYADHLRHEGLVNGDVIDRLIEDVVDEKSAYKVLEALKEAHATALGRVSARRRVDVSSRSLRDAGWSNVVWGGLCIVGGIGASVFLEMVLRVPAISGLVGLGLGIWGLVLFLKGLSQFRSG